MREGVSGGEKECVRVGERWVLRLLEKERGLWDLGDAQVYTIHWYTV